VAWQLYTAVPAACALADLEAFLHAVPLDVRDWVNLVRVAQPVPVALLKSCAEYVADRHRRPPADSPASGPPTPKEDASTQSEPKCLALDANRRIARRYAKLEHLEVAHSLLEAQGKHAYAARLRRDIERLRPYLEKGLVMEEADAAYRRDHLDAAAGVTAARSTN
jgi:hypothetical protein